MVVSAQLAGLRVGGGGERWRDGRCRTNWRGLGVGKASANAAQAMNSAPMPRPGSYSWAGSFSRGSVSVSASGRTSGSAISLSGWASWWAGSAVGLSQGGQRGRRAWEDGKRAYRGAERLLKTVSTCLAWMGARWWRLSRGDGGRVSRLGGEIEVGDEIGCEFVTTPETEKAVEVGGKSAAGRDWLGKGRIGN